MCTRLGCSLRRLVCEAWHDGCKAQASSSKLREDFRAVCMVCTSHVFWRIRRGSGLHPGPAYDASCRACRPPTKGRSLARCGPKKKREGERKRKKQRKFTALRGVGGGRTLSHQHRQGSWPVTLERWNLAAERHCTLHGASASQPKPGRPTAGGPLLAVVALASSSSSPSPPIASSARP